MSVTLTNADNALKTYYLDAVSEQLNVANPFYAKIKQTSDYVFGKEIKKLASFGVNGGVGAGTEEGNLPSASGNNYAQFTATLKNLYGSIEISDKAVRASASNSGAFVNLLNAEMEGLVKSGSFNLSRMLFGDGSGVITTVSSVADGKINVANASCLFEGMLIDVIDSVTDEVVIGYTGRKITFVDRVNKYIKVDGTVSSDDIDSGDKITVQGSFNKEITGIGALFDTSVNSIYGLTKSTNSWLNPYVETNLGTLTESAIQTAIDAIELNSGSQVNYIICSFGVRRALQNLLTESKRFVDTLDLAGGYKAISYNGIPVVADRFCPDGTMYLLNTDDFILHQLCDWEWLSQDDGKILHQVANKPIYSATLVKYAELVCEKPCGQGMISGITEG